MTRKLPWVPRYARDLARDVVDPETLPPEARDWYLSFLDEYYGATPHGISSPAQIAEANRRRAWDMRQDLFSAGLRASGDLPEFGVTVEYRVEALDAPEAQALLRKIRAVRPEFDATDGRRRARFKSPLAEKRFYALRKKLQEFLLTRSEDDE